MLQATWREEDITVSSNFVIYSTVMPSKYCHCEYNGILQPFTLVPLLFYLFQIAGLIYLSGVL